MTHSFSQIVPNARNQMVLILFAVLSLAPFEGLTAIAQVTTSITPTTGIGDLGTTVTPDGNTIKITGGARSDNGTGSNLFHSFDQFSVGRGDTAQFLNTTPAIGTDNILGRVTGGNPSSIFGTIDTTSYPGANLFLMNPAGIVFGPNATLNVGGSVAFTTADYLRLADVSGSNAGIFHANTALPNLLTSSPVAAFGFLGSNPAAIAVQGSKLTVDPGQSISLVGGNHSFTFTHPDTGISVSVPNGVTVIGGHLKAPDGQIKIASVASPGEVLAENLDKAANINKQSFGTLGTVQISQLSHIDTSGENGGRILVRGGRLLVDESTISANTKAAKSGAGRRLDPSWLGIGIEVEMAQDVIIDNGSVIETNVEAGADHESGGVRISADKIEVSGGPRLFAILKANPGTPVPFAGIKSNIVPSGKASKSGDISLQATAIQVKDLGKVETQTDSAGNAGNILLSTVRDITIMNSARVRSLSTSETSTGNSGNITISSGQGNVSLQATAFVQSQAGDGSGNAGSIAILAPEGNISLISDGRVSNFVGEDGTGTLGGIQITANDLLLDNKSFIVGNNFSNKVPGNIVIALDGHFTLSGNSAITIEALGPANAANLIVKASDILITDGSFLFSGPNRISTAAGGVIDLSARSLTIQNGGKISAETFGTEPSAKGGSILVTATDHVVLTNGASISASSKGTADAGNIKVDAGRQLSLQDSGITTEAQKAKGGNIEVIATDRINLSNGQISTSVLEGGGDSGKILIDPREVIVQNNSTILSQAVQGNGGDISIRTARFLQDPTSLVDASSQFGQSGRVTIQSSTSNLSGTVAQLSSNTAQTQPLLQNRCVAQVGGGQSTFLLAGRDTLPAEPSGWLGSPVSMEHWTGEGTEHASGLMVQKKGPNRGPSIASQKNETKIISLRRLTPPGFLVRTFATGSTGCPS